MMNNHDSMKKLEVTDKKERMKLLIDGAVFTTRCGGHIYFNEHLASSTSNPFCFRDGPIEWLWSIDWYYL